MLVRHAQAPRQRLDKGLGVGSGVGVGLAFIGKQPGIGPAGLTVSTPADRQRPARQLLARVPLALAEVQETAATVVAAQALHQVLRHHPFGWAERVGVPFGAVAVIDADKGRLATHRQAHIAGIQPGIHHRAQGQHVGPLRVGVRLGHPRRLVDAGDRHGVREADLAGLHLATDRRGAGRLRRTGQRDMALTGEQARGRVQANPAGTGQIDLAPGVQVGEIDLRAAGPIQRLDVGLELDQVARDEARRQPQVAQRLHQQPAAVAARAAGQAQRLLRRLHPWLHPDQVADTTLQTLVDIHQEIDRAPLGPVNLGEKFGEQRRCRLFDQVRLQFQFQGLVVDERKLLSPGL